MDRRNKNNTLYLICGLSCLCLVLASVSIYSAPKTDTQFANLSSKLGTSGRMAVIWSHGRDNPPIGNRRVHIYDEGLVAFDSRMDGACCLRWLNYSELMLEDIHRSKQNNKYTHNLRILNRSGRTVRILNNKEGLTGIVPSLFENKTYVTKYNNKGNQTSQIRKIDEFDAVISEFHGHVSHVVWSPDGKIFAAARWTISDRSKDGKLWPRIYIFNGGLKPIKKLYDGPPNLQHSSGGAKPVLWTEHGLFAIRGLGLVKCDATGGGCIEFYDPGKHRRIFGARNFNNSKALLLVGDLSLDIFEIRAKEIHKIDLNDGSLERVYRTPKGTFIDELDWISN